jgi:hypothetical protein
MDAPHVTGAIAALTHFGFGARAGTVTIAGRTFTVIQSGIF